MGETVGIAIVGVGTAGQLHAAAVRACSAARLVGVYDARAEQAEAVAREYGCRAARSLDELLDDPDVTAVSVVTPMEHHREPALRALAAGKHVLVEKPVGASVADVEVLARAARESGKLCVPAHNSIYMPEVRQIKRRIDDGSYGQIVSAWFLFSIHHPPAIAVKYPGVLRQIATHHLYTLLYLLGKPARLVALVTETRAEKLDREDEYMLIAQMPNGALVNLFASFAADDQTTEPWTNKLKVIGTGGGGTFSWRDSVGLSAGAGMAWRFLGYEDSFMYEVDYFVRRCLLAGEPPLSSIEDAVTAQRLIEAAEESIRDGRVVRFEETPP